MATKQPMKAPATETEHVEVEVKCDTRINGKKDEKGEYIEPKISSVVTLVFDDDKAAQGFAKRGAIIAWQQMQRDAGSIPETDRVLLSELAKNAGRGGFKMTPDSIANKVRKMPVEEYTATLRNLGINEKEIAAMVKRQYK